MGKLKKGPNSEERSQLCTCRHGSRKDKVGSAAAEQGSFVIAAVDVNAVQRERQEVGDERPFPAFDFAFVEGELRLDFLYVRSICGVFWDRGRLVLMGKRRVCHSGQVSPLPVRPGQREGVKKMNCTLTKWDRHSSKRAKTESESKTFKDAANSFNVFKENSNKGIRMRPSSACSPVSK